MMKVSRALLIALPLFMLAVQPACARQAEPEADAATLLARGQYEQAVTAFRAEIASTGAASSHRGLIRALLESGQVE